MLIKTGLQLRHTFHHSYYQLITTEFSPNMAPFQVLSQTFCTVSAEGKRLDSALLKVQVIRQRGGLRLCYSPGSHLVSGVL